jgi:hypothetical protein
LEGWDRQGQGLRAEIGLDEVDAQPELSHRPARLHLVQIDCRARCVTRDHANMYLRVVVRLFHDNRNRRSPDGRTNVRA